MSYSVSLVSHRVSESVRELGKFRYTTHVKTFLWHCFTLVYLKLSAKLIEVSIQASRLSTAMHQKKDAGTATKDTKNTDTECSMLNPIYTFRDKIITDQIIENFVYS